MSSTQHPFKYLAIIFYSLMITKIQAQQENGNTICGQHAVKIYYTKHGIICATTQEEPTLRHLSIDPNIVSKILSDSVLIPMTPTSSSSSGQQAIPSLTSSSSFQPQESRQEFQYEAPQHDLSGQQERYLESLMYAASTLNSRASYSPFNSPYHHQQQQFFPRAKHLLPSESQSMVNFYYPHFPRESMFEAESRRFTRQAATSRPQTAPANHQFVQPEIHYGFRPVSEQTMSGQQGVRKLITRYRAVNSDWNHESRQPKFETLQSENERDLPPQETPPEIITAPPHLTEPFDGSRRQNNDVEGKRKQVNFSGMQIIRVPKDAQFALSAPLGASFGTRGNDERFIVRGSSERVKLEKDN